MTEPKMDPRAIVPTAGSAAAVTMSADSVAYLVEQLQLARWTLQRAAGELEGGLDAAMARRRIDALGIAIEQLTAGAAQQGVGLEVHPDTMAAAEQQAARRAGGMH